MQNFMMKQVVKAQGRKHGKLTVIQISDDLLSRNILFALKYKASFEPRNFQKVTYICLQ